SASASPPLPSSPSSSRCWLLPWRGYGYTTSRSCLPPWSKGERQQRGQDVEHLPLTEERAEVVDRIDHRAGNHQEGEQEKDEERRRARLAAHENARAVDDGEEQHGVEVHRVDLGEEPQAAAAADADQAEGSADGARQKHRGGAGDHARGE